MAHPFPDSIKNFHLLSDGTVLGLGSQQVYKLTPDSHGSYVNGTWSQLATMYDSRIYYASGVMPNGQVLVDGAEYGSGTSKMEIYDPVLNKWTKGTNGGWADNPSVMLPNGDLMLPGSMYNPSTGTWTSTGAYSWGGENTWLKLPDGSILDTQGGVGSQRYIPSLNQWINDAAIPAQLWADAEQGGAALLADGRAFYVGSTGNTDIYTPSGSSAPGSWVAGPKLPNNLGENDGPVCMMTDGKVLCSAGPSASYSGPTSFYIYDPATNAFTLSAGAPSYGDGTYTMFFLALPDGKVLTSFGYVYDPGDAPVSSGHPVISSITPNSDGSFVLSGTGLNGISEGASYGDDHQMNSNYPLVRLTAGDGTISYARTYNWSSTGVQTGSTPLSVNFALPLGLPAGTYSVEAVGNGLASSPTNLTIPTAADTAPTVATAAAVSPSPTIGTTANLSVLGASGNGESTLTYTWVTTATPAGVAAPSLSANATNAAKNTVATFPRAGAYSFKVYISDSYGLSTSSSVTVTVNQTLTSINLSPAVVNLTAGQAQQLSATGYDQFGVTMASQPPYTWALVSGGGTLSVGGLYTSPASGTLASITATSGAVQGTASIAVVSSPWTSVDVGSPGLPGTAYDTGGVFTVNGDGSDIWGTSDQFHFVYQQCSGDSVIVAKIATQQATSNPKTGVMIRESLAAGSTYAFTCLDLSLGAIFETRSTTSGSSTYAQGPAHQAPYWLKVIRQGNAFTSQASVDGVTWTTIGTVTVPMSSSAYIGLASDSGTNGVLNASTFSNVYIDTAFNVAPQATATASSIYNGSYVASNAIDANANTEWASAGQQNPWIQLNWAAAQTISGVTFLDRANLADWAVGGTLTFSDNSTVTVSGVPNDGTPYTVSFSPRSVTSMRFQVVGGSGPNVGLNELMALTPLQVMGVATSASAAANGNGTAALSVLGQDPFYGESGITYTWAATSMPNGATAPSFAANGTNAAKNTTAIFEQTGTYTLTVTLSDAGGATATSSVSVNITTLGSALTWNGGGGNGNLSNAANWVGGVAPQPGDQLILTGTTQTSVVNDYPAGTAFRSLSIQGNNFALSGNPIALDSNSNPALASSGTGNSISMPIVIAGNTVVSVTSGALTMSGAVSGTGSLVKSGTGTLNLPAANTYTGTTNVSAGTVNVSGSISPSSPLVIGSNGSVNATLQIALPGNINVASLTTVAGATGSTLVMSQSTNAALNVTGMTTLNSPLKVTKTSNGVWCIFQVNGITGGGAGAGNDTLIFSNPGGSQMYPQGGSGTYDYSGNVHFLTANGSDYRLQGASIFAPTASVTLDSGALVRNNSPGTNFAFDALNGAGQWDTFNGTTSTLTIGSNNSSGAFSGVISNSGGTTSVVKAGTGTQTFSGTSSYTGATTVNGGALNVTGSIASSTVTVSGGALAGTGAAGATTVSGSGTLAPGVGGVGTLSFNNKALSLTGTAMMEINKAAGTNDKAQSVAALSYGGTLTVSNLGGSLAAGDTFTLFSATSYSGSFAAINLPSLSAGLYWSTSNLATNGSISVIGQTLTSITVSPSSANLASGGTQQFTATGYDQFNNPMVAQPSFTWTALGGGSINGAGFYTASYASGTATVAAASGAVNGTAGVTVTNSAPTVATAATASPGTVSGTTTSLSVLGNDSDGGGESNLTYAWTATAIPSGATTPTYSANGTNAAKNATATVSKAGAYTFRVTISDAGGLTTTSSVNVTVSQTLASITVTPANPTLGSHGTQQFTASGTDQFGASMSPTVVWTNTGAGSINGTGLYTASAASGTATVTATSGSVSGSTNATVTNAVPTVATAASASPSVVTGPTTNLSVLGADSDDGGESTLTYTWSATTIPSGATAPTYSANGSNAAKNTTATFTSNGLYTFTVTIADAGGLSVTSSVDVTVAGDSNGTWSNVGGGSWPTTGNWIGGSFASGANKTADFSTLNLTANATVTLDGARTIGNLIFGDTTPSNNWTINTGTGGPLTLSVASGMPTVTVNNQTTTIGAVVAGSQGLLKAGIGTLVLGGNDTLTGAHVLSQGVLTANHPNAMGAATNTLTLGNASTGSNTVEFKVDTGITSAVNLASIATTNYGTSETITLNAGSALAVNAAALVATVNLDGSVPLTLRGTNTGGHGTAQDINCRFAGTGIPSGTTALILDGTSASIRTSQLGNSTAASNFTGDVLIKGSVSTQGRTYLAQTAANQNLNFLNNDVTVSSGATWTIVWGGETAGALNGSGNVSLNNQNALNSIGLTLGNTSRNGSHSGVISGGFGVAKTGTATQILSGASTYSGPTSISGGTLLVNGSLNGTGAVTVASGATLGGSGSVKGATTVANGGILAPGNAGPGTFSAKGNLTLNAGAVLNLELGTTSDQIAFSGTTFTAPSSGTAVINVSAAAGFTTGTYPVITGATGITTTHFSIGSVPVGYSVSLNANAGTLSLVVTNSAPLPALGNTGTVADLGDSDGDGISDRLEYATGRRPDVPDSGSPVALGRSSDGTKLTLAFHRIADTSLVYTVQGSDDLVNWQTVWSSTGTDNTEGDVTVSDNTPMQGHPKRFLRLMVGP